MEMQGENETFDKTKNKYGLQNWFKSRRFSNLSLAGRRDAGRRRALCTLHNRRYFQICGGPARPEALPAAPLCTEAKSARRSWRSGWPGRLCPDQAAESRRTTPDSDLTAARYTKARTPALKAGRSSTRHAVPKNSEAATDFS